MLVIVQVSHYRLFYIESVAYPLDVECTDAAFASWYELSPCSALDDEQRHGMFDDIIRRLGVIHGMGFDILYFPLIRPIGRTSYKGRSNSLRAKPDGSGSPYTIGATEGGRDAVRP